MLLLLWDFLLIPTEPKPNAYSGTPLYKDFWSESLLEYPDCGCKNDKCKHIANYWKVFNYIKIYAPVAVMTCLNPSCIWDLTIKFVNSS